MATPARIRKDRPLLVGYYSRTYRCPCGTFTANAKRRCTACVAQKEIRDRETAKERADAIKVFQPSSPLFINCRSRRAYLPRA